MPWDIVEICWYNRVNISKFPIECQDVYYSLLSNRCIILKEMTKSFSRDFIATCQIIFHTDIIPITSITNRENIKSISNLYIYNPWITNHFFSKIYNNVDMHGNSEVYKDLE